MAIGLNLNDNIKVELGENKDVLITKLGEHNIEYDVPFDKVNKDGIKETLITMRVPYIEISAEDDIITYIKTENTEYSNLDNVEDTNVDISEHIKKIQNHINDKFKDEGCTIKLEKLDIKTLNITLILQSSSEKARIQIIRDTFGKVYINTIRKI